MPWLLYCCRVVPGSLLFAASLQPREWHIHPFSASKFSDRPCTLPHTIPLPCPAALADPVGLLRVPGGGVGAAAAAHDAEGQGAPVECRMQGACTPLVLGATSSRLRLLPARCALWPPAGGRPPTAPPAPSLVCPAGGGEVHSALRVCAGPLPFHLLRPLDPAGVLPCPALLWAGA